MPAAATPLRPYDARVDCKEGAIDPPDDELVRAAQRGEIAALGLLIERYRPALFASALALTRNAPMAQDAVQDTSLIALRRIDGLRDPSSVGPWLHAVVRRCCLQELRHSRSRPLVALDAAAAIADPGVDLGAELERAELGEWVWEALATLPEAMRVTAMLRFFDKVARRPTHSSGSPIARAPMSRS